MLCQRCGPRRCLWIELQYRFFIVISSAIKGSIHFSQATVPRWGCGIPVVEKSLGLKLSGFASPQQFDVGIAFACVRSWAAGVVFGIVGGFNRMRVSRVPLAPACRHDMNPHLGKDRNQLFDRQNAAFP
jgi:hypothetical protein